MSSVKMGSQKLLTEEDIIRELYDLFNDLLTKRINCCGTVRSNRKGMPADLCNKRSKLKRGDIRYLRSLFALDIKSATYSSDDARTSSPALWCTNVATHSYTKAAPITISVFDFVTCSVFCSTINAQPSLT
ncbi:hypothetical protein C0J52_08243 [Blattella germanica]|nr:hypothetical protein C0J52_08243 [Blattella germanica]